VDTGDTSKKRKNPETLPAVGAQAQFEPQPMMFFYPQSNAPAQSEMIQHGGAGVVQYALQPPQAQQMIQVFNQMRGTQPVKIDITAATAAAVAAKAVAGHSSRGDTANISNNKKK
jgi:hypothetical protein